MYIIQIKCTICLWDKVKAFYECSNLKNVTIPDGVTSVGNVAFKECKKLKQVIIPESVKEIGDGAFRNCTSLVAIELPQHIRQIRRMSFDGCSSLKSCFLYRLPSWPNIVPSIML